MEESRKRPRTPKKTPREDFDQASKQAVLKNRELFDVNRSFLQIDKSAFPQSENTRLFEFDSDTNAKQKMVAYNDASLCIGTFPDSPPIGKYYPEQQKRFFSHKSTSKNKAVKKIKAANMDS